MKARAEQKGVTREQMHGWARELIQIQAQRTILEREEKRVKDLLKDSMTVEDTFDGTIESTGEIRKVAKHIRRELDTSDKGFQAYLKAANYWAEVVEEKVSSTKVKALMEVKPEVKERAKFKETEVITVTSSIEKDEV